MKKMLLSIVLGCVSLLATVTSFAAVAESPFQKLENLFHRANAIQLKELVGSSRPCVLWVSAATQQNSLQKKDVKFQLTEVSVEEKKASQSMGPIFPAQEGTYRSKRILSIVDVTGKTDEDHGLRSRYANSEFSIVESPELITYETFGDESVDQGVGHQVTMSTHYRKTTDSLLVIKKVIAGIVQYGYCW